MYKCFKGWDWVTRTERAETSLSTRRVYKLVYKACSQENRRTLPGTRWASSFEGSLHTLLLSYSWGERESEGGEKRGIVRRKENRREKNRLKKKRERKKGKKESLPSSLSSLLHGEEDSSDSSQNKRSPTPIDILLYYCDGEHDDHEE